VLGHGSLAVTVDDYARVRVDAKRKGLGAPADVLTARSPPPESGTNSWGGQLSGQIGSTDAIQRAPRSLTWTSSVEKERRAGHCRPQR